MRVMPLLVFPFYTVVLIGCASQSGPAPTPVSSTQGTTLVQTGQVTDVRDVTVRGGQNSSVGSVVGSILGGFAGSGIGSGHGRTIATVAGAAAGGMAGQHAGKSISRTSVTKITVRFENGDARTYDIESHKTFRIGDPVKIISNGGTVRVVH